ncbi:hypothetical protein B7C62_28030 [Kitasatospora albolonga]|uniref:Uncharacterized protein n=1 Tax=Kitasatospora albolonga TaxID=68173 RepID=A0ABC8BZH8_9ACTN|nr:hypothetical protein B7C62_28030 [Kitasatospora albolonga]
MTTTAPAWLLAQVDATDDLRLLALPVGTSSTRRVLLRTAVPVNPGDALDVSARAQITNDTGRVIGVGVHLWVYDVDVEPAVPVAERPWTRIAPHLADNCTPNRHHMPLHMGAWWVVPEDWPPGHRVMVAFQAAAFRTSPAPGETVRVDQGYGQLVVRRYVPAPPA